MERKTTKEILAASFRELAAKKSIDKITIRDIVNNCGYSPATFYRQFGDKYDLIAWDYTRKLEVIMSHIGGNEQSWRRSLKEAAEFYDKQRKYLANLFTHTSGLDSFVTYMHKIHYNALKSTILELSGEEKLSEKTDMVIRTYVAGTVQVSCEWVLGRYDCDAATLAQAYEDSLPEILHRYLLSERD